MQVHQHTSYKKRVYTVLGQLSYSAQSDVLHSSHTCWPVRTGSMTSAAAAAAVAVDADYVAAAIISFKSKVSVESSHCHRLNRAFLMALCSAVWLTVVGGLDEKSIA